MRKKLTTEIFIERAKKIHGNKYDYSKAIYKSYHEKICIICPKHGEFWQLVHDHLNGHGCPKCGDISSASYKKLTTDEFIEKSNKIHNNKYDYSKVNYKNISTKVCIICPEHGEFWQSPNKHLNGQGCPKCHKHINVDTTQTNKRKTIKEFIQDAKKVHGEKYNYSKVEYKNNKTKVCIICPKHGEFWQKPNEHLGGQGCPKCASELNGKRKRLSTNEFIEKAKKIHGNKYNYSLVNYHKTNEKVCIICPEHGEFWQTPKLHLKGCGCPKCKESNLEEKIRVLLENNKISYIQGCNKSILTWLDLQHLDFYLPDYKIAIECQGTQHYKENHFYEPLSINKERDEKKLKKCILHNVKLLYFAKDKYNSNVITDEKIILKKILEND